MPRTTPPAVQAIIEVDTTVNLDPYILAGNALVTWLEGKDSDNLLSADLLELIETYLAAHFYEANRDRKQQSKGVGGANDSYQGQTAMVLSSTDPGQTAMLLDVTGKLAQRSQDAQTGKRRKARVLWAGLPKSSQTAYDDRD